MKRYRAPVVLVGAMCVLTMLAPAAFAKYTLHNGNDVTQTDVVAGSEYNSCGNRITGHIGWGDTVLHDPLEGDILAAATAPASYEVFQYPPGYDPSLFSGAFDPTTGEFLGYYTFTDPNGTVIVAPRVHEFTTGARTVIPTGPIQQPLESDPPLDPPVTLYVYTDVAFDQTIAPAAPVGASFGLKPIGGASLLYLNVVNCTPPPGDVIASIDAQPLSSANKVSPSSTNPTLAILVKGSSKLNVTAIASAKVGGANPVTSGIFGLLSKPFDVTGDGRKDRVYFFRPNQTGLTCTSKTVTIAGTLTGGGAWKGTDAIKPVC